MTKSADIEASKPALFPKLFRSKCPCCDNEAVDLVQRSHDDRNSYPDVFTVVSCVKCGYCFIQDPVKQECVPELYRQYYPESPGAPQAVTGTGWLRNKFHSSRWGAYLEGSPDLAVHINDGESVLDVGCSFGTTSAFAEARKGKWFGVEIDPKCCAYLKNAGLSCYNGTVEEFSKVSKEKFDVILLSQVFEHLYNPIDTLGALRSLLNENGRVIVCMPNFESRYRKKYKEAWLHWHVPYHVGHWSKRSLSVACNKAGFYLHAFSTRTFFAWWRVQRVFKTPDLGKPNPSYPGGGLPSWMRRSGIAVLYHLFVDIYMRLRDLRGDGDLIVAELRISR